MAQLNESTRPWWEEIGQRRSSEFGSVSQLFLMLSGQPLSYVWYNSERKHLHRTDNIATLPPSIASS